MFTNGNLSAPISVLLFLGAGLSMLLVGLGLVYAVLRKKAGPRRLAAFGFISVVSIYFAMLLFFSFRSSAELLARGQEKHFCEIDCHLAYSVDVVREEEILGEAPNQLSAAGKFRMVTIKTRFDQNTISANRGDGLLYPNSRVASVVDENGKEYFPSTEGQRILASSHQSGTPMTTPLRPGESYTTTLVFDLPLETKRASLLIQEGEFVTHFLIGHENSPLHKKTRFQI